MAIRESIAAFVAGPTAKLAEPEVRAIVEAWLAERRFVMPADLDALRAELGQPESERLTALEAEITGLKKKLSMAMGALQAAQSQLADARKVADEALATSAKATQQAGRAAATAESAADGLKSLNAAVAAPAAEVAKPATRKATAEGKVSAEAEECAVPDCHQEPRARGFCARHYQAWKRNSLEDFISSDGTVKLTNGTRLKFSTALSGQHVISTDDGFLVDGKAADAQRI